MADTDSRKCNAIQSAIMERSLSEYSVWMEGIRHSV